MADLRLWRIVALHSCAKQGKVSWSGVFMISRTSWGVQVYHAAAALQLADGSACCLSRQKVFGLRRDLSLHWSPASPVLRIYNEEVRRPERSSLSHLKLIILYL